MRLGTVLNKLFTSIKAVLVADDKGLRSRIRLRQQAAVRELRGQLYWEGDLDAARAGRMNENVRLTNTHR